MPQWVRDAVEDGDTPRTCHTCILYDADGKCSAHDATPPPDYVGSVNECGDYLDVTNPALVRFFENTPHRPDEERDES
jgi:hypothetical protein